MLEKNRFIRSIVILVALLCTTGLSFAYSVKDVPNVHVQNRSRFLSNPDGIISAQTQVLADDIMRNIWQQTSAEVIAVVLDSISTDTDPETFATELFELWGVGKSDNDNGLLLLVSVKDRAAVIRTGYGMEGVVPDITGGKIIRNNIFPYFRNGDYDGGLISGLTELSRVITDPEYSGELNSRYKNDADADSEDFIPYLIVCGVFAALSLIYIIAIIFIYRKDPVKQWEQLAKIKLAILMITVFCIGIPILSYLLLIWQMKRVRNIPPPCNRCGTEMQRLKEPDDHRWLSSGQLTERRLKSVNHEVWECPACHYGAVRSFRNPNTKYTECELCHATAKHLVSDKIIKQPTTFSCGIGERVFKCEHCNNEHTKRYEIPRKAPIIVATGGGRGGGFGGFSGGSFGGGHTGGGGASGRW